MPPITFHFFYNDSTGVGVASLSPTVNIYRIPLAGGAGTLVVNGAAAVEDVGAGLGGGFYNYRHADDGGGVIPDLAIYNYTAKAMVVVATVQAKQIPALWVDYSVHVTGLWTVLFAGITVLANWLRGIYRKDAMNVTAKTEVNTGGGTYDETTDSNQAIQDNIGLTGSGLSSLAAASIFTGITNIANWLRGLYRKDAMNAAAKLEVNVGGGLYDETTDSNQAIADAIPVIPATVTVSDITQAALAKFANTDTGEVAAIPGSVAELSQCNAAGFPAGAIEFTYTVTKPGGIPVSGVSVWVSTDAAMTNIIWRGETDAFGVARDVNNALPWLDAGPYYFWVQHEDYAASNPDLEVVS